jgi:hypothetical protein
MRRPGLTGDTWPDNIQELLLRAALLQDQRGAAAWLAVRPSIDIDHLPGELHRLIPLLFKALSTYRLDDPDLARLRGVYQFTWYRNTTLFADAAEFLQVLSRYAIPTMVLRGAAIATAYRADAGARAMNDFDVLVPEPCLGDARRLAEAAGWRPPVAGRPLEIQTGTAPIRNSNGRLIRLHGQPSPNLSLSGVDWGGLWHRAVPTRISNVDTCVPSAADHLVHACVDGIRANSGASLRWITDAMTLLAAPHSQLEWDVVKSEARRLRVTLLMSVALRYLRQELDAEVPQEIFSAFSSFTTRRDRLAHRLSLETTPPIPSGAELLGRFIRLTADRSLLHAAAVAPQFFTDAVGVQHKRDMPVAALRKVARAIIRPTPPLASLSKAPVRKALDGSSFSTS